MQQQQPENGEDNISKSTKQLNAVMIKTIGDLLEPIMSDMTISESNKSTASSTEISEAAQAKINERMEVMVNEVFKPLVKELKHIFGSPEAILDFSGSEAKIIPIASNSGSKIEVLTKFIKDQSVEVGSVYPTTAGESSASSESSPDKSSKKNKKKKSSQNSVKKFGEDVAHLPLSIECFHNNCDVTAESWPALERHLEESHGFTSLSQSAKLLESGDSPQFSPFSIAKLQTPRSVRERWAELMAIVRMPNVKSIWMEDVIEGEEELERLNPKRPPKNDSDDEHNEFEVEDKTTMTEAITSGPQLDSEHSFTCKEKDCDVLVSSVTQLNHHLIHQHGVMPHTCLVCNDVFDQNMYGGELYSHSWHRHRNFEGTYSCQHCDQQFSRHCDLSEHIHLYHMATTISAFELNPTDCYPPPPTSTTSAPTAPHLHPHQHSNVPLQWVFDYPQAPPDHSYHLQHTCNGGQEVEDISEEELMAQYFSSMTPTDYIFQLAEMADAIAAAEAAAAAAASAENPVQS